MNTRGLLPNPVRLGLAAAIVLGIAATACDVDRGARQDLPNSQQTQVTGEDADVWLFPDKFPNVVHRCADDGTGIWTTTDRNVWIVYNDPACPGANREALPLVLDNIPGAAQP